jgi:hypothetical protein
VAVSVPVSSGFGSIGYCAHSRGSPPAEPPVEKTMGICLASISRAKGKDKLAAEIHIQNPEPGCPREQQGAPRREIRGDMNVAESDLPQNGLKVHGDQEFILDDQDPYRIAALCHGSPGCEVPPDPYVNK